MPVLVVVARNINIVTAVSPAMNLSLYIDHTALKPGTSRSDISRLCKEAIAHNLHAVCVPPIHVSYAAKCLEGSEVTVCTVAGFPIGYDHAAAKESSIRTSVRAGATEVDIVINMAAVKSQRWGYVADEMRRLANVTRLLNVTHKFIFETGLLDTEEIERLCTIANDVGVDFVKTSTGMFGSGATVEVIQQLRRLLNREIRIKASGGIASYVSAVNLIKVGADRIGTSKGVDIIQQQARR